jgi:hypothetical protein
LAGEAAEHADEVGLPGEAIGADDRAGGHDEGTVGCLLIAFPLDRVGREIGCENAGTASIRRRQIARGVG